MFVQTVSDPAQDLDRAADDRVNKLTVQKRLPFVSLGVHSWFTTAQDTRT